MKKKKIIIALIIFILIVLIVLIIISNIPTYRCVKYDLKTDEILIYGHGRSIAVYDKAKIDKIIKLINNGKDGTELFLEFKEYNKGFNKILKDKTGEYPLVEDFILIFNENLIIQLYDRDEIVLKNKLTRRCKILWGWRLWLYI